MKKEQAELVKKRKELTKDLRNAERKKRRLRERAKLLSDRDLMAVLELRQENEEKRTAAKQSATSAAGRAEVGSDAEGETNVIAATEPIAGSTEEAPEEVVLQDGERSDAP